MHTTATQITWQTLPNCTYNLYSSEQWPVDTEKAENLMLVRHASAQLNIPAGNQRYYALAAMDRYGNESLPTQCSTKRTSPANDALLCTGNTLRMPDNYDANEGLLTLSTLNGTLLQTLSVRNKVINMQGIADGVYQLRTLNAADVILRFCLQFPRKTLPLHTTKSITILNKKDIGVVPIRLGYSSNNIENRARFAC